MHVVLGLLIYPVTVMVNIWRDNELCRHHTALVFHVDSSFILENIHIYFISWNVAMSNVFTVYTLLQFFLSV